MPLTDAKIRNLKPREKAFKKFDARGLYLLIFPHGSMLWRFKYRRAGKEKLLSLGAYPEITLAKAREGRDDAKRALAVGNDPSVLRKQQRLATASAAANTFKHVALEWIEKRRNTWKRDHATAIEHSLEVNIFPDLGARPISAITSPELLQTLRKIEHRGALDVAQRALQRCSSVFRYGVAVGLCASDPARDLRGALKSPDRQHHAALKESELPEFLEALDAYDGRRETALAIRMLMLTFVRTGELRGAEWSEFDLAKDQEWRIPGARMKMKVEHIVPLSRQAIEILEELRPLTGHSAFVFPNQVNSTKCMSENTMLYALYRMGYHSRATGHGFRTTASTILNEQGFPGDAIERQLAHADSNDIRAVYNKAEYLPTRRKMMQAWADYLDGLGAGAKVTPIRKKA